MIKFSQFQTIVEHSCERTTQEFLSSSAISISKAKQDYLLDEVAGPSIEVQGERTSYMCLLEYKTDQNIKYLEVFKEKYPFLNQDEIPEVDLLDLFGEYLNILCGKINKEIDDIETEEMNIEIPFFEYGLDIDTPERYGSLDCKLEELSFRLHYALY